MNNPSSSSSSIYSTGTSGSYLHTYTTLTSEQHNAYTCFATSSVTDGITNKKHKPGMSKYAAALFVVLMGNVLSSSETKVADTYNFSSLVRNEIAISRLKRRIFKRLSNYIFGDDLMSNEKFREI